MCRVNDLSSGGWPTVRQCIGIDGHGIQGHRHRRRPCLRGHRHRRPTADRRRHASAIWIYACLCFFTFCDCLCSIHFISIVLTLLLFVAAGACFYLFLNAHAFVLVVGPEGEFEIPTSCIGSHTAPQMSDVLSDDATWPECCPLFFGDGLRDGPPPWPPR